MKGLVLAGGSGSRLRPITYTGAKQLLPVANRPILHYVLDNLVDAGIDDIGIVISPETGQEVIASLGDGSAFGAKLTYILQDKPAGLAHAVKTAHPFLGDAPFCMFLGDNLIGTKVRDHVAMFETSPELEAAVMLKEVANPSSFGVAEVSATGDVTRLVEKPKEPKSNLALVGIYLFRKSIFEAISKIAPSPRGELEITDAISKLIELDHRVRFSRVDSWWFDTGNTDDLLRANETVLDSWLVHDVRGSVCPASRISGRVRIEEGAVVVRSVLRGPVTIGRGAQIVEATIDPFTSVGNGVRVERSSVARSVLLEGATILDVPRLEDSLVGRRVRISKRDARRDTLSLIVGDDCRIEISGQSQDEETTSAP
jgi:glucose-1-phosphate thymidylyltransferase